MDTNFNHDRFLGALRAVQRAGGNLRPKWLASAPKGYIHFPDLDEAGAQQLTHDLDYLAHIDHLDRLFFDRLTICPSCGSHHVNVREVCADCGSPNIMPVQLLHHYRCGYVGHADSFPHASGGGRQCPKCHGKLQDLGTDHDSPGENFLCHACHTSFQVPDVESICLSCHTRSAGDQLLHRDIYSYRLTSTGMAALSNGRLFERHDDPLYEEGGSGIYRRHVFMSMLEDERRRARRYGTRFALVVLRLGTGTPDESKHTISRIDKTLRDTDKIGRYDEKHVMVLMPETCAADAWLQRINAEAHDEGLKIQARTVDLAEDADPASQISAGIAWLAAE